MRKVARVLAGALVFASACDDGFGTVPVCADSVSHASVDEPRESLAGESAQARFDRTQKPWDCSVTWLELPTQLGSAEPPAGSSALELVLEGTSDTVTIHEYPRTEGEKLDSASCPPAALFVPSRLALTSDDGALDEAFECELRLQGENTLVHLELADYEFVGSHTVSFVDDIPVDWVELNLAYTPGPDPVRIDGTLVEYGTRSGPGVDPFVTTAVIACTL
jgi:hypothetical protein